MALVLRKENEKAPRKEMNHAQKHSDQKRAR
jgi:hypothetical protein